MGSMQEYNSIINHSQNQVSAAAFHWDRASTGTDGSWRAASASTRPSFTPDLPARAVLSSLVFPPLNKPSFHKCRCSEHSSHPSEYAPLKRSPKRFPRSTRPFLPALRAPLTASQTINSTSALPLLNSSHLPLGCPAPLSVTRLPRLTALPRAAATQRRHV